MRRAGLRGDRAGAGAQRKLGEADGEVPALLEQVAPDRVDELAAVRRRLRGRHLADLGTPLHIAETLAELTRELVGQAVGEIVRGAMRRQDADDDRLGAVRGLQLPLAALGRTRAHAPVAPPRRVGGRRTACRASAGAPQRVGPGVDASTIPVVIVSRDRRERLLSTLARLAALPERPAIVVVDNGSRDGTVEAVRARHREVQVLALDRDRGASARNVGLRALDVPYVALCDDDSWWAAGALQRAARAMDAAPRVAVLAARVLVGHEERLDPVCELMARSPLGYGPGLPGPRVLGFVACGAVMRREAVLAVGGFDEHYGIGGEENRLALDLARAGWWLAYAPSVVAHHHPGARARGPWRTARTARNDLWTAWLHRSLPAAVRRSAGILAGAGATAPLAAVAALRGAPRIARRRRPLAPEIERELRVVERQAAP
jgi:GT2 family glycosyltransferase